MSKKAKQPAADVSLGHAASVTVHEVRSERVVLDHDVARLFDVETKRLNEQVTRNKEKFGDDFSFRLTPEEFEILRSQNATSSSEWGGARYPPRVFTEHGVVMAATMLKTPRAIQATRLVVRTFIDARRAAIGQAVSVGAKPEVAAQFALPLTFQNHILNKVAQAMDQVLDAMVNPEEIKRARAEARGVLTDSVRALKELLNKPGIENEHRVAEIRKLMAEAESIEVETDGRRIKNEELQLALLAKKLSLVMQAQHFAQTGRVDDFLRLLHDLSGGQNVISITAKP